MIQTNHSSDPDVMEVGENSAGTPVAAHTISRDLLGLPGSSASGSSAFSKYEKPSLKSLTNHTHPSGSLFNSHTSPLGSPSASFSSRKSNSHNHKRNKETSSTASSSNMVSDSRPTSRKFVKSDSDSDDASDRRGESRNTNNDIIEITLTIKDTSNNDEHKLLFRSQQTVGTVKQDISDITEIPAHRQLWTGWPAGVSDEKLSASLESELPPEPADHNSPDVVVMRFRHPGTDHFIRAFTLDTALQVVLNYLHVRGFAADQYKFLQSWPRRDLASLDVSRTLKDYSLPHQETITIAKR